MYPFMTHNRLRRGDRSTTHRHNHDDNVASPQNSSEFKARPPSSPWIIRVPIIMDLALTLVKPEHLCWLEMAAVVFGKMAKNEARFPVGAAHRAVGSGS